MVGAILFIYVSFLTIYAITLCLGESLGLFDDGFKSILVALSTSLESSPYFLRGYDNLCSKYMNEGNRNAVLISLRRISCDDSMYNMLCAGYILGEVILSRGSITGDTYFIYVHDILRGHGLGTKLYHLFERAVIDRGASVGVKVAAIRISLRQCIVKSVSFWKKHGFDGSEESSCLIKTLNLK